MVEKYRGPQASGVKNWSDEIVKKLKEAWKVVPFVKDKSSKIAKKESEQADKELDSALEDLPSQ